jgi:hypothetical protein
MEIESLAKATGPCDESHLVIKVDKVFDQQGFINIEVIGVYDFLKIADAYTESHHHGTPTGD